jgi:hypothetical protein
MFNSLFKRIYSTIFVNIVVGIDKTDVYIEVISKKQVVKRVRSNFETISVNEKMIDFILSYTNDTPYFYISLLDNSSQQGAISSCSEKSLSKHYNLDNSKYMCTKDKWIYYTSAYDLNKSTSKYQEIGLDFIFSPFLVLSLFFKDEIYSKFAMYILIEERILSLSIFNKSKLLFATQICTDKKHSDEANHLIDSDDLQYDFSLEEEDEHIEEEENFSDIEELESSEESKNSQESESSEVSENLQESENSQESVNSEEFIEFEDKKNTEVKRRNEDGSFKKDYIRYTLIQKAVNFYYQDEKYESGFIEEIYIADNISVSSDLKVYLQEEMYSTVNIRDINLSTEICKLAKAELS